MRRTLYLFTLLSFLSWGMAAPKNIVLFVADDHGQDAGCYGNPVIQTPHLDRLAEQGTRFTNAFATTASCSASRSVILTGLYNHRTGQYGHQHDYHHFVSFENLESLPVLLEKGGYRTASVGKYHVAPESVYHFQNYLPEGTRNPVEMANRSRQFIAGDSTRPFFLYFCTSDPHRGGGTVDDSSLAPDRFGNREGGYEGIRTVRFKPEDVLVPPYLPDTPTSRKELAQYYESVARLDQGVGHLMKILEEEGVWNDTLFIYISDHGIAFPGAKTTTYEPGLRSPCIVRNPYAERRGVVNHALINWTDLTPTILEFAGIPGPEYENQIALEELRTRVPGSHGLHGKSLMGILEQEHPEGWDETYASHTFHEIQMYYPMRVVRTRQYKLIWNIAYPLPFPFASDLWAASTWQEAYLKGPKTPYGPRTVQDYIHRPEFELFDLEKDPWESSNLAGDPRFDQVLVELKEKLQEFQKRTSDPWFLKWSYE